MIKMDKIKIIAAVAGILMIIFAGAFAYTYSIYGSASTKINNQQDSVVLGDAFSHWNDISIENASLLQTQYAPNAELHWIGGPLSGTYRGVSNITATWNKFFNLWGAVWFYTITPPTVSVNSSGAMVTSQNQFVLTPTSDPSQTQFLNISYELMYTKTSSNQNGGYLIQNEVWKITAAGFVSVNQDNAMYNDALQLAFSHWNNIAIENISTVMNQYASNATLNWAAGPLKGMYNGTAAINMTWTKFFGLWNAVWFYTESPPVVNVSGNVATVSATVQFVVQSSSNLSKFQYINVTYTLKYYNFGFNEKTGMFQYEIVYENFDNTAIGNLSKV